MNVSTATRWALNALLLLSVVIALYLGRSIFIPMIIALLLVAMLWPAANWLNRGVLLLRVKFCRGCPWLRPCLFTLRAPWSIACTTMRTILVAIILLVPVGFGLAGSRMLQDIRIDPEQEQEYYQTFRERMHSIHAGFTKDYLPPTSQEFQALQTAKTVLTPEHLVSTGAVAWLAGSG